ncbi:zinc-binding dehydrogenase [Embleya sp. NPDC050154]|uniref:zinc-binding dehydrogenase n=1 Tax=Embleya sp. NPDC050154 TaxID=3363988 RepID=UPI0037A3FB57
MEPLGLVRAVGRTHARRPLPPGLIDGLPTRDDCPAHAFAPLAAAHPEPTRLLAQLHRPAPAALLGAVQPAGLDLDTMLATLDRSLARTVTGDDLLRVVRPATLVLEVAQGVRDVDPRQRREWDRFNARPADLLADRRGADIGAWRTMRGMLKEYPGTIVDLADEAVAQTRRGQSESGEGTWPGGRDGIPELTGPWHVLKGERAAFVALTNAAATPVQRELLRNLDDQTASDLPALGTWRPQWTTWARACEPGGRERVLIARHQMNRQVVIRNFCATSLPSRPLSPEVAADLARLDDPTVNAALIYQSNLPRELRDAVPAGVPLGPQAKSGGHVPFSGALRAELLDEPTTWTDLLPAFGSGDPRLTAHCLASGWAEHSPSLQLRVALGLWERNGPELLRHEPEHWLPDSFDDKALALVRGLPAEEDTDAALERLRAATAHGESTAGLLTRFRTSGSDLNILRAEGFAFAWDELHDAFQRGAPDPEWADQLASDDQCASHLRDRRWVQLSRHQRVAVEALKEGRPPAGVLAAVAAAPRSVSLAQAATLPLPGLTALQTLDWLALKSGERLLIAGAAGAVGGLALQIARARGARVDALVSRDAQGAFARAHGADFVTTDRNTLQDRHYDAVFDTFGAFVTEAVADGGRYASIATQAGPVPDMSSRSVRTTVNQVHEDGTGLDELARLVDDGSLRPRMASVFGLQEIQAAHARFLQGGLAGKIAVVF